MKQIIMYNGNYLIKWEAGKLQSSPMRSDAKVYFSEFAARQACIKLNIAFKYTFTIHPHYAIAK